MSMRTQVVERPSLMRRAMGRVASAVIGTVSSVRGHRTALRDHVYTIFGFCCLSGACFYHSVFTGLLVTGFLFLLFEWKVADSE